MIDSSPATVRSHRRLWIVVYALLAPVAVVPLLVPLYDRTDPTLFGFPFFYWFQFALIPAAALLMLAAYVVSKVADARATEPGRRKSATGAPQDRDLP